MKLVEIERFGTTAEPIADVPDIGRDVCASMIALYEEHYAPPWVGYLCTVEDRAIGTCAFKSPPQDGRVEIAYFTFPGFEGRGYATAMARELLSVAAARQPGILVVAQTLPADSPSTSVLKRLGFRFAGKVRHPEDGEVWEWHYQTDAHHGG